MTRDEIRDKISELERRLIKMELSDETEKEFKAIEDEIDALEKEDAEHEMSYDLTVTVTYKVHDIRACSEKEAEDNVFNTFSHLYGVYEVINAVVDDEREIEEAC